LKCVPHFPGKSFLNFLYYLFGLKSWREHAITEPLPWVTTLKKRRPHCIQRSVGFEQAEVRALSSLIFVLNGNAFGPTSPTLLTANAAQVLDSAGNQAIQISTPKMSTASAFYGLARGIRRLSHGSPIGIVGFSSGGSLAARLSAVPSLRVVAALDYYGPPSLSDYLREHVGDIYGDYMRSHIQFTRSALKVLSGPCPTSAYVVAAFGLYDQNVVATVSTALMAQDFPAAHVYEYPAGHGVSISASPAALQDFLAHV
jgi:dienelactone hydrolase